MTTCTYKFVYIVLVTNGLQSKVSQEGYESFTEAQEFIESREGIPERVSSHLWKSEDGFSYEIAEVGLKMIRKDGEVVE